MIFAWDFLRRRPIATSYSVIRLITRCWLANTRPTAWQLFHSLNGGRFYTHWQRVHLQRSNRAVTLLFCWPHRRRKTCQPALAILIMPSWVIRPLFRQGLSQNDELAAQWPVRICPHKFVERDETGTYSDKFEIFWCCASHFITGRSAWLAS